MLPPLPCLGKSIPLEQKLYRVYLEPTFSLPCSTASAMTFPSQSPRHQGGQDSAAPRAAVREILRSWAGSVSHRVVSLHAHTWAWQLEDFLVLPSLLKVPANVVTGSISSPCSLPLWPLCCLQDLGSTQGLVPHTVLPEQGCRDAPCSPGTSLCPGHGALTALLLHRLP